MNSQLETLLENNPQVWRAKDAGRHMMTGTPTGHPQLDATLPAGGWPNNAIMEMVTPQWGMGELQLLLPLMRSITQQKRWILWISPPYVPYAPALERAGIDMDYVIVIQPDTSCKDALWSIEKALQTQACALVLAWLNWLPNGVIRRLQLAAETGRLAKQNGLSNIFKFIAHFSVHLCTFFCALFSPIHHQLSLVF